MLQFETVLSRPAFTMRRWQLYRRSRHIPFRIQSGGMNVDVKGTTFVVEAIEASVMPSVSGQTFNQTRDSAISDDARTRAESRVNDSTGGRIAFSFRT